MIQFDSDSERLSVQKTIFGVRFKFHIRIKRCTMFTLKHLNCNTFFVQELAYLNFEIIRMGSGEKNQKTDYIISKF